MASVESAGGAPIVVTGARTNNLRDVSLEVPKHLLTVFTGVSGSGKSSLVLDTIAAESQRLVNDSYSTFIRARLPQLPAPEVQAMDGLTFTVLIDQRRFTGNARSTVATATDLASLLRLVFSRIGEPSAGYSPAYSFNDPSGMCPTCEGLGTVFDIDVDELIDPEKNIDEGPVRFSVFRPGVYRWKRFAHAGLFDRSKPLKDYTPAEMDLFLYADQVKLDNPDPQFPTTARFDGVVTRMRDVYFKQGRSKMSASVRAELDQLVTTHRCPDCRGARLNAAARASLVDGRSIVDWVGMSVSDLRALLDHFADPRVAPALKGVRHVLDALLSVGLGYLTLDRESSTLSGGEAQRVKIVRHLGSALTDVTYVFDEPSAGLHPADIQRLVALLKRLRDRGNTILVVEHHPQVIAVADHVVDLGPGAGADGGRIEFEGTPRGLRDSGTITGRLLAEPLILRPVPRSAHSTVRVTDARSHNLTGFDVDVPLGVLTAVTGVAGSGKSSFATIELPRQHPDFTVVGQEPLRGGVRSMSLTVLGVADAVRGAFSAASGLDPSWFSFNGRGACPTCKGKGHITTELAFLDDVSTPCDECGGLRFNDTALSAKLDGMSVADVLAAVPADIAALFADHAGIASAMSWMRRTGLGYLAVGRSLDTLSGGEKQRLLLARHLSDPRRDRADRIVLDEPTTGLHPDDVDTITTLFDDLIDGGATFVVVEHNMRVVARADHVIDIGPGAGSEGGRLVFEGPPAELAARRDSLTGVALAAATRAAH
ncbi:excinuclease ABC subunit UvrA [Actinosynnema sp. NPDC047251]|uniref:UvrABC system protein A n=1 Tax=Saccharothrix espanaensis (strain ATCC 51144 / DSM 44229 / JCM 9112 / NBRC 15066 / NRRL 15764) TaxID=1179773 RepID=K0K4L7_SACES|nr:Nogalamycin resistance protein [Saccharothrix espanaensis]CCH31819.1 Nogalamycin resistance protein [Saccharothrix espanaensis DSM 44229]